MAGAGADRRGLLLDGLAVVGLAALLVAIHLLLPAGVRHELTLRYADPDPLHAWTAAFVHLTDGHLRGNVLGLLLGGGWAVAVSHVAGERRWFRLTLLSFMTVLPVAIGLSGGFVIGEPLVARGFSGVVAGFAGFGLVAVAVVLHRTFGVAWRLSKNVATGVSIVLAAEILWLVSPTRLYPAGGLVALGLALTLVPVTWAGWRSGWPTDRGQWRWVGSVVVATAVLSTVPLVFVVGLFPTERVSDGSITNILAHYLGLVYGAAIAGWGYRYWSVVPPAGPGNRRS